MILVAGVAVGIVAGREVFEDYAAGQEWRSWIHPLAGFVLMLSSALMLIFQLRRPRPLLRRVADQQGFVACFAMVAFLLALLANQWVQDACQGRLDRWAYAYTWGDFAFTFGKNYLLSWSVVVGWGLLAMGRRWRPEPGWIDGIGRALGYAWIAWGLVGLVLVLVDQLTRVPVGVPSASPF